MSKVKMKVSGCFRTIEYAHGYCLVSSYLQPATALGYNTLTALNTTLIKRASDMLSEEPQTEGGRTVAFLF